VFTKVSSLLRDNLAQKGEKTELPSLAQTAIDLTNIIIPYLPADTFVDLWSLVTPLLGLKDDPNMQRRGYRCLTKLAEVENGKTYIANKLDQVEAILKRTDAHTISQKDRILALHRIIDLVPTESLHIIPTVLPEAVIGTKENNEKAREAAYNLLIAMGRKMQAGGTVKNAMVDGMDEDAADTKATIGEYFLMVSAGLAGTSQHMVSATITALSRMLYEFKGT
jgi:ribosomal RNA-processing protein 12